MRVSNGNIILVAMLHVHPRHARHFFPFLFLLRRRRVVLLFVLWRHIHAGHLLIRRLRCRAERQRNGKEQSKNRAHKFLAITKRISEIGSRGLNAQSQTLWRSRRNKVSDSRRRTARYCGFGREAELSTRTNIRQQIQSRLATQLCGQRTRSRLLSAIPSQKSHSSAVAKRH